MAIDSLPEVSSSQHDRWERARFRPGVPRPSSSPQPSGPSSVGTLYSARELASGRACALEILPTEVVGNGVQAQASHLLEEILRASRLLSAGAVPVFAWGFDSATGIAYLELAALDGNRSGRFLCTVHHYILPKYLFLFSTWWTC